jgi:hypothetical protein
MGYTNVTLLVPSDDQEANIVRRFLPFPFHSGGRIGTGEDGTGIEVAVVHIPI